MTQFLCHSIAVACSSPTLSLMTLLYAWYDLARKYDYGRKAGDDDDDGYAYGYSTYSYGHDDDEEYSFTYGTGSHYGNIYCTCKHRLKDKLLPFIADLFRLL